MTQPGQMVTFPVDDPVWSANGTDGLYVMLVVPTPRNWDRGSRLSGVDIVLTGPDVGPAPGDHGLWDPQPEHFGVSDQKKQFDASSVLKAQDRPDLATWALRAANRDELSHEVLAAVHMGNGPELYDPAGERHWHATSEDLTAEGKTVWAGLAAGFGIEPVLMTFLET